MKIIDEQGFVHILWWRINIIDFLAVVYVLCLIPMFYFGYKVRSKTVEKTHTVYELSANCPICGYSATQEVDIGKLPDETWVGVCKRCGNEVSFRKPSPIPQEPINYEKEYYKRMLNKLQ